MRKSNLPPQEAVYTPERDAIIARDYPAGVRLSIILARVSALPGPAPRNEKAIKTRAHILGAKRPKTPQGTACASWSPARCDLLTVLYPDATNAWPEIVDRMNDEFPDLPTLSHKAIEGKAVKMGLRRGYMRRRGEGRAGSAPVRNIALDQPMQSKMPPTLEARIEKAAGMIGNKGRDVHVWSVVAHTGLDAWQVCMVAGRIAMGLPLR